VLGRVLLTTITVKEGCAMKSQLLAFRVARPAESLSDLGDFTYDPETQTSVWVGDGKASASKYCTRVSAGWEECTATKTNCRGYNLGGATGGMPGWWCD
jgi:hypothetical protein